MRFKDENYLKAFPGYWSFPGGKVEKGDEGFFLSVPITKGLDPRLLGAAVREGKEELGIDLREEIINGKIGKIDYLGLAISPDFNPYRYATSFFRFRFTEKIKFSMDYNEALVAHWIRSSELLDNYEKGRVLAVPPIIKVINTLAIAPETQTISGLNLEYDESNFVPCIESLKSVRQIMPLSHTLPPAMRTNAFLIGDGPVPKVLIDPSPKDSNEYQKFKNTVALFGVDKVMLTHHHPDHHEFSVQFAQEHNVPICLSRDTYDRLTKIEPAYFRDVALEFLKEGQVLTRWLGRQVIVYEVPGHDEGQLALAPEDMSWFLAGDLFQSNGTVVIGGEEGNMAKYFATLEKIILLNPKVVFPSHGIGLGGVSILERTLEHRRVRENQVLTMHHEGLTEDEMLATIYADVTRELWPYARKNIQKHLAKLKAEGKIN